jgi:hypothetical protein
MFRASDASLSFIFLPPGIGENHHYSYKPGLSRSGLFFEIPRWGITKPTPGPYDEIKFFQSSRTHIFKGKVNPVDPDFGDVHFSPTPENKPGKILTLIRNPF